MTTPQRAQEYLAIHMIERFGRPPAVFNPNGLRVEDLPVIYGFNNGGSVGWFSGCLIAQDGNELGGHICSDEGYMPHDLDILEGSRPDRHEGFQKHYPDGYRMEFVGYADVPGHDGLQAAFKANSALPDDEPTTEAEGTSAGRPVDLGSEKQK